MTDDEVVALFNRLRWPPDGQPTCVFCGAGDPYNTRRNVFRCSNRECRRDFMAITKSALAQSKISPSMVWLGAECYCEAKSWRNGREMARRMNASPAVGWRLSCKFDALTADDQSQIDATELIRRALQAPPMPYQSSALHRRTPWSLWT